MNCHWINKVLSIRAELAHKQKEAFDRHLAGCWLCRIREEQTASLERELRQTLHAVADRQALRPDESAAMLARLVAEMKAERRPRRGFQPLWSWVGATVALLLMVIPLCSPWLAAPGIASLRSSPPPVQLAANADTPRVRSAMDMLPAAQRAGQTVVAEPTPTLSVAAASQPTAWPAMELTWNRSQGTAVPRATSTVQPGS